MLTFTHACCDVLSQFEWLAHGMIINCFHMDMHAWHTLHAARVWTSMHTHATINDQAPHMLSDVQWQDIMSMPYPIMQHTWWGASMQLMYTKYHAFPILGVSTPVACCNWCADTKYTYHIAVGRI